MEYQIINKTQRPWGYEVRIKVLDDNNVKGVLTIRFPKEPFVAYLDRRCKQSVNHFEAELSEPVKLPDRIYTTDEVTQILRTKGYLSDKEQFSDEMPVKEVVSE